MFLLVKVMGLVRFMFMDVKGFGFGFCMILILYIVLGSNFLFVCDICVFILIK